MGVAQPFCPAKLFIGAIYADEAIYQLAKEDIINIFGETDLETDPFSFSMTDYYQAEMGDILFKRFLSIRGFQDPETAYQAKLNSNDIEANYMRHHQRLINLDPGILTLHNIVLLTTKNFSHRIPLQKGIYAETTLIFDKKTKRYQGLPWTYPDFLSDAYQDFFISLRST